MARAKTPRPISNAITPSDGRWHGFVTVGTKVNGKPDRVHRTGVLCATCRVTPDTTCACYLRVEAKVRALEDSLAAGVVEQKGTPPGVAQLAAEFVQDRVDRSRAYGTLKSYRTVIEQYIAPSRGGTAKVVGVGGLRVHQLDETRINGLLADVRKAVSAQAARKTLRVLRAMLTYAESKKYVRRNEATFVPMPQLDDDASDEPVPLTLDEIDAVVPVIMRRRNAARWLLALVHGPRQGECLGLAYHRPSEPRIGSDVNIKAGTVRKRKKIGRRTWEHGCDDPHACGGAPRPKRPHGHHKTKPCPQPCNRHTRTCPPPCAKDCVRHASACPKRKGGGLVVSDPKSKASKHTIVLEPVVLQAFIDHAAQREADMKAAGSKWSWQHGCKRPADCSEHAVSCPQRVDSGYVFTDLFGKPIDPKRDWDEWQSILLEAGLPPARVHDLRHTAATNLVAAGVDPRVRQRLMGWSQDMPVYEHLAEEMQRDAVRRVGGLLWSKRTGSNQPEPDPIGPDSATTVLPVDHSNVIPFRRKAV